MSCMLAFCNINLFADLFQTQEYFTHTMLASIIMEGNRAVAQGN